MISEYGSDDHEFIRQVDNELRRLEDVKDDTSGPQYSAVAEDDSDEDIIG